MPYNFLDANQVNEFRASAKAKGIDRNETEEYIRSRKFQMAKEQDVGLDIQKREVESLKLTKEKESLISGKPDKKDLTEKERLFSFARNAAIGAYDVLTEENVSTGPITTRVQRLKEKIPGAKATHGTQFRDKLAIAQTALKNAFLGGQISVQELESLSDALPNPTDQEDIVRQKLEDFVNLVGVQIGEDTQIGTGVEGASSSPGLSTGSIDEEGRNLDRPALNIYGEIAKSGDLSYNEQTGSYYNYGDVETDEQTTFKTTKEGSDIDNSFIKWLADSEFLPIAGSVVAGVAGGITLGPAGSILTGAAGAVAGKSMQQGIRELFDSEQQDMSEMATAVIIEGSTDALMGGVFWGLAPVLKTGGKWGLKMVFGEGAEATTKELMEKGARDLTAKGLGVKPMKDVKAFSNKTAGSDLVSEIMEKFGVERRGTGKKLVESAEAYGKEAAQKKKGLLAGKFAKTAEVVEEIKKVQHKTMTPGAEFKAGLEPASNKLDKVIKEILSYGDEIPLQKLEDLKLRLGDAFPIGSGVTRSATKIVQQDAYGSMKKYIEKFHPDIAGTNRAKQLAFAAREVGENLEGKKAEAFVKFHDLMFIQTPETFVVKKAFDLITGGLFSPISQAKMLETSLKMATASGDKLVIRNIMKLMMRMGVTLSATGVQSTIQPAPGMNLEQSSNKEEVQPGFMYR